MALQVFASGLLGLVDLIAQSLLAGWFLEDVGHKPRFAFTKCAYAPRGSLGLELPYACVEMTHLFRLGQGAVLAQCLESNLKFVAHLVIEAIPI